jgi:hypothetical protein
MEVKNKVYLSQDIGVTYYDSYAAVFYTKIKIAQRKLWECNFYSCIKRRFENIIIFVLIYTIKYTMCFQTGHPYLSSPVTLFSHLEQLTRGDISTRILHAIEIFG